jgi:acyl-CoA synthetase (AMP-forming)/AMP-acid ligase II
LRRVQALNQIAELFLFIDQLPRTALLKIDRRALRALAR